MGISGGTAGPHARSVTREYSGSIVREVYKHFRKCSDAATDEGY
jgi:hypothetical protein